MPGFADYHAGSLLAEARRYAAPRHARDVAIGPLLRKCQADAAGMDEAAALDVVQHILSRHHLFTPPPPLLVPPAQPVARATIERGVLLVRPYRPSPGASSWEWLPIPADPARGLAGSFRHSTDANLRARLFVSRGALYFTMGGILEERLRLESMAVDGLGGDALYWFRAAIATPMGLAPRVLVGGG
jgi:hypothetical protein